MSETWAVASGPPIELLEGRLYALANGYSLDGRCSWHPSQVRGTAPMNCYLLVEGERALLIDTGLTVHEQAVVEQIESCLPEGCELEILAMRLGEFDSVCNIFPIVERF